MDLEIRKVASPAGRAVHRNYLLGVLLLIFASNNVDRIALGLVLQTLKTDLQLTDVQLGLLSGLAFALFYSVMGIPIARWADRGNRITIISVTTALWSVAVALCAVTTSFLQLLVIRVGAAIGEAGCVPPAHSLIADHFSRAERPRAMSRYLLGGTLAYAIGYFVAGWLNEWYGWRRMFLLLGLPGLGLAALAAFTLRDPRRNRTPSLSSAAAEQPSIAEVCMTLWRTRAFRHLLLAFSVLSFFGFGIGNWQPAFFIRSFGLKTGELGMWMALIWGVGGSIGTYIGGVLAARYAAHNERLQLRAMVAAYLCFGIIGSIVYLSGNVYVSFALLALAAIGANTAAGPLIATIQTLVRPRMRAMSIAILYLFANLIGMGLGPLAVGGLSDALRPWLAEESLRYALLAMCPGYVWAAWHLWRAGRTVARDIEMNAGLEER